MRLDLHMAALLVVFAILPSTLYSVLLVPWLIYVIARRGGQLSSNATQPAWPAVFLLLQGLVFGQFSAPADMVKDGWYIFKMLMILQSGALIGYYTPLGSHWLRPVAWAAAIISLDQALRALSGIGGSSRNLSFVAVFLTPFILKYCPLPRMTRWLLVSPTLLTIALAQSRTGIVVLALAWMGVRGIYQSKARLTFSVLALVVLGSIGFQFLPEYDIDNITFLGKIQNSVREVSFEEGYTRREMYANWRGFEAFRAYVTWMDSSSFEKLVGGGLGQYIDLGAVVALTETYEIQELPYAHNGYFSVLVKFGLLGMVVFLYMLAQPFLLRSPGKAPEGIIFSQMATTASLLLIVTTLVISGPLNRSSMDGVLLIFGAALGGMHRLRALRPVAMPPSAGTSGPEDQIVPS